MKIIQVNNFHRFGGGSDLMTELTTDILESRGHEVILLRRDSGELTGYLDKAKAFTYGLFSPYGWFAIKRLLRDFQPNIVHVHELYPLFSPWILRACRKGGVPVVMTCHDFRLICPTAFLFHKGEICESCIRQNELWCIRNKCRGNFFEDIAFALRHWVARRFKLYKNNITLFITLSKFAKQKFISHGFSPDRFSIIPNPIPMRFQNKLEFSQHGNYFSYVGRISREKGIDILIEAARITKFPICLAGDHSLSQEIVGIAPKNVQFCGFLDRTQLEQFYKGTLCLVLPSRCYEMFGLVLLEAMVHGIPVIAPRLGGIPEIVEDGNTGFLFEPGNPVDLAKKMEVLWNDVNLAMQMGKKGRQKAIREHSQDIYYDRLIAVYEQALVLGKLGEQ
jgi:glycosyltransferase involved in cell wall biosynthesis